MPLTVSLSDNRETATLKGKRWSVDIRTEDIPSWIEMYEEIRDRKKYRYRKNVEEKGRCYCPAPENSTDLYDECAKTLKATWGQLTSEGVFDER